MFEIVCENKGGARLGRLHTAHSSIETPCFMPVATHGSVKTLNFTEVKNIGYRAIISNALILYLRPGVDVIKRAGGVHRFINWKNVIFTDSGGFQMLNPDFIEKIKDGGVVFRSPFDRSRHLFSPEKAVQIQNELGSDVAMTLDALIPYGSDRVAHESSVEMTTKWAKRCKEAHNNPSQLLFAITQGGIYDDLRKKSAEELVEIGFDGYGIGGLSIGESKEEMHLVLKKQTNILPRDKPRYLMGVGSPVELIEAISSGVDIFDSTFPTRNARHNDAYTFSGEMNLSRGRFREDPSPIEPGCGCYTCRNHSRAYVHHLLRNRESTGLSLMTIHNLYFIQRILEKTKDAIRHDRLFEFKKETIKGLNSGKGAHDEG